jgi:hypothetical protein
MSETIPPWEPSVDDTANEYAHRMWLEVIGAGHGMSEAMVTTLRAGKSLYARQYPYGGPAVSGDLEIGLDLEFDEKIIPEGFGHAVGNIEGTTLQKTPIVSKMRVNSRLIRTQSQFFDDNFHHGAITLSDPSGVIGAEVPIKATHLNGVEETLIQDSVGLAFSHERPTSLLSQLLIPYDDLFTSTAISLRLGLLVPRIGNLHSDALRLSYRIIQNPSEPHKLVNAFPQSEMTPLPCDFALNNSSITFGYYFTESDKIAVSPGDIFILKVERRPPDGFMDRLVLLRMSGLLNYL